MTYDNRNAPNNEANPAHMHDVLSILTHGSRPLAKIWHRDGSISDYTKPKHFSLEEITVHNIRDLSATLSVLEKRTRTCLIRGKYIGDCPEHTVRRKEVFDDQSLHIFLAEIDNYRPALFDPILEPQNAIEEYITTQLPECFRGVSYHYQMSNSAGHPTKQGLLKAHVWFYLSPPYTSAQLKAWAKNNGLKKAIDISVCDPIQVHYTALPIFEGQMKDPITQRSGFVLCAADTVDLILDRDSLEAKTKKTPKGEAYKGTDATALWLEENGIAKSLGDNGKVFLDCPFAESHTDGKIGETDTTYLPPRKGFPDGMFHCSHASCAERTNSEFENELGYTASYFDFIPSDSTDEAKEKYKRFDIIRAGDYSRRPPVKWLIKGIFPEKGFCEFVGGSGDGKTFVVLDMMLSLCRGADWNGYKIKRKCKVVYICAEGAGGFVSRLQAYAKYHDVNLHEIDLGIIVDTPNFRTMKDVEAIAKRVNNFGKGDVIIIDTLAQVTPGADENTGKDMSTILNNCQALMRLTDAACGLVHHTGKDVSKGARGWSGQKAPLDAQFLITKSENGKRKFWIDKMKDGRDGFGWHFELETINFGVDADGDVISSCVVKYIGNAAAKGLSAAEKSLPLTEQNGLHILEELIGKGIKPPNEVLTEVGSERAIHGRKVATYKDWQDHYVQSRGDVKKDSAERALRKIKNNLLQKSKIKILGTWVWIPEALVNLCEGAGAPDMTCRMERTDADKTG